jgi:hypothetical protein
MKIARDILAAALILMLTIGTPMGFGAIPGCMDSAGAMTSAQMTDGGGDCDDAGRAPSHAMIICHGASCVTPAVTVEMQQPEHNPVLAFEAPQGLILWSDHSSAPEPRPPSILRFT